MDERVQPIQPEQEERPEPESLDVRRFPYLVDGAKASGVADRRAIAGQINGILVAMRTKGHEADEAKVLVDALYAHQLDGLVDKDGRACRKEAVETLLASGFPHALQISHEDLQFARTWQPPASMLEPPWAEQLRRGRKNGAGLVVGGELLYLLTMGAMGVHASAAVAIGLFAGLAATLGAIFLAISPPTLEGQSKWVTPMVFCALVQMLTTFSVGPAALLGGVGIIAGCLTALSGQAQPLNDPPDN
jgi:hypothetical protein